MDGGGFLQLSVPHDKAVFAGIHVVPLAPACHFKAERSLEVLGDGVAYSHLQRHAVRMMQQSSADKL